MSPCPKVELHLHLEGAAPPTFIRDLAKKKSVNLTGVFDRDGGYAFRDFGHFLTVYDAACSVLKTPEDYHRLTLAVLEEQAQQGVIYTEAFLSPEFCGGGDLGAWREYVAAIREAAELAFARDGTRLRGIVTAIRHLGPDAARITARCAAETAGDWVVGFGLAGDERKGRPRDYVWSFDMVREAGLSLTAHAGEWGGAASVRDALDDLGVSRIGHGVRAIEDPALVERLVREGVVLEVCPGSNIALGVYPRWKDHPIERLRAAGVPVTVSTDDPPFFKTTLTAEYAHLAETFGWEDETVRAVNQTAARAAFCDDATKTTLLSLLEPQDD
ncbi:adenosine deaminase [Pseudoruegeria sp. SK021]|uniref:adenosine deaminase n=1 Tax=Pseudoruegeria sp. SK021 TaxID=1933035 RepID=UPI000A21DD88|nr:adenosine deaminase [Pseudoruegeria sp. SK021]OSP53880.1 adenosine deaminase [Pseudoruegeria sp. SK021]